MLPDIHSSSEVYGEARVTELEGVPVAGILGDQQAALFGQTCFDVERGEEHVRNGGLSPAQHRHQKVHSKNGLLTTVGYRLGAEPPVYALEGIDRDGRRARAVAARRPRLIDSAPEVEDLGPSR